MAIQNRYEFLYYVVYERKSQRRSGHGECAAP